MLCSILFVICLAHGIVRRIVRRTVRRVVRLIVRRAERTECLNIFVCAFGGLWRSLSEKEASEVYMHPGRSMRHRLLVHTCLHLINMDSFFPSLKRSRSHMISVDLCDRYRPVYFALARASSG